MEIHIPEWVIQNASWALVLALGIGYSTYLIKRKSKDESLNIKSRRRDDDLINRLIEQNELLHQNFIEAYKENSGALNGAINALRAVAGEVQQIGLKQSSTTEFIRNSFEKINEQLIAINNRKQEAA